ncbi:MAG: dihydrolipoyl dehydrogenase family protein, partial [Myxococcota bacterium]
EAKRHGIEFGDPRIDLAKLRAFKDRAVSRLTRGLSGLAEQRRVEVLRGDAAFTAPDQIRVVGATGPTTVSFDDAIVAAGSRPIELPDTPSGDSRLIDSTGALALEDIPARLLVVGGGIIGLEMATVYAALGSAITLVEFTDTLIPGCDRDLVKPLERRIRRSYENIFLRTRVARIDAEGGGLRAHFDGKKAPESDLFDRVLVAVGRRANADRIGAEAAGLAVDERGLLRVDSRQRTNVETIYAVGDITGPPMLAHKASHEGRVAAEVIAGLPAAFDAEGIPSVAYTDPEIAWVGLSETDARERDVAYEVGSFPWSASGRALSMGRNDGMTKLLVDPQTRRILGAGMVGRHASELVAEAVVAMEMGAEALDIGPSIHPHPTLSETLGMAAEMVEGTITDLYAPK